MKVKEIIGIIKITAMPRTPAFIKRAINLIHKPFSFDELAEKVRDVLEKNV